MPTNEERRNIAHAVRRIAENNPQGIVDFLLSKKLMLEYSEEYVGGVFTKESVLHLADIIEPEPERTCEIVTDDIDRAHCSLCGYEYYYYDGTGIGCIGDEEEYEFEYDGNFCKNCGAKVINNANE